MLRSSENIFMRHATAIAITAVTVFMAAAALIFYEQAETAAAARGWVNHTYEVKEHIEQLMNRIIDATTAQRGYLLTGDQDYLEPYRNALSGVAEGRTKTDAPDQFHSIQEEYDILTQQTADNPLQQRNMDELDSAIHEQLAYLASVIELRKTKGAEALQLIDPMRGKLLMDHLRYLTRSMNREEDHLLALRLQADEASTRQSRVLTFSGIGIFYALMILGIWIYQKTRKRAQSELLRYAQQLECNEEELRMQQEELKASNEEIEASNQELEEQNAQIRQQTEELARSKERFEEKAAEADKASAYKSEFLANMSHELRTPLNSLLILARSLANNEDGNLTEAQIEEARIIHNDGLELLDLINDILDLSKVEAGKLSAVAGDITLDSIVQRVQQPFAPIAKQKKVAFPVAREGDLPATLHTDAQRVEQILKNLLSNAFKFTDKGSVTLRIHRPDQNVGLQRASLDPDGVIAFSVIDTGIGIDESKFKHIFEAFQQEDGSTDRHYGGTGLGLTIARKFAHLVGGEIHVASIKGIGSTFTLILPIELPQADAEEDGAAPDARARTAPAALPAAPRLSLAEAVADGRKTISMNDKVLYEKTVLLVDDDRRNTWALSTFLKRHGLRVILADNGQAALDKLRENPAIDLVIMDVMMPVMDGYQAMTAIRGQKPFHNLPILALTARAMPEEQNKCMAAGASDYLTKPVDVERLLTLLRLWLFRQDAAA